MALPGLRALNPMLFQDSIIGGQVVVFWGFLSAVPLGDREKHIRRQSTALVGECKPSMVSTGSSRRRAVSAYSSDR